MKLLPLGGAGEVGASSALLEIAGARILIDLGIRVGSAVGGRPLPALHHLTAPPDAVVITHAHTDHTGALPLALPQLGDAEIHMTVGTLHLLEVLQGDAARNSEEEGDDGDRGRIAYTIDQIEAAIARVVPHGYHTPFCPVPGRNDIVFEYGPCGHILGAASLVIDSPEGRILWLGDYSVVGQPTIGGLDLEWIQRKASERPFDLVVSEGTYGSSEHPAPDQEAGRFIRLLEKITRKGGRVLIPAFAVGRAQDITLVIRQAKLAGRLENVPLYLDGMVRPVTSIYENIAHELYPHIHEPLALLDAELGIYKANSQSRAKLINGEIDGPAIVVSSSGMLVGGRSVQYGRAFAGDPKAAILISGYQDEESPGRALLSVRRGARIRMGEGPRVRIRCHVGRYHTSAHADARQIQELVDLVNPKKVLLVHGDPASLGALRERLGSDRAVVLRNEKLFRTTLARRWNGRIPKSAQAIEPPKEPDVPILRVAPSPTETQVRELWQRLLELGDREYSEAEIARMFLGTGYSPVEREILSQNLANHRLYFISGSKIGQKSYRPRPKEEVIHLLIERGNAYQIPLEPGNLVVFSDGSPDLYLAAVAQVHGVEAEAIIPFSGRRSFRRDWVRCKLAISLPALLARQKPRSLARWLEGVLREARALPPLNPVDVYYWAREHSQGRITVEDALRCFFPGRDGLYSRAMHVATALAMAGSSALFALQGDGTYLAREPEDVESRWRIFRRIRFVRELSSGESVRLANGDVVLPTGVYYADSFEAQHVHGGYTRVSYRRILLPGEDPATEVIGHGIASEGSRESEEIKESTSSSEAPSGSRRRRRRRFRRGQRYRNAQKRRMTSSSEPNESDDPAVATENVASRRSRRPKRRHARRRGSRRRSLVTTSAS